MSKLIPTLTAAVLVALNSTSFAQHDDLFSNIRQSAVFGGSLDGSAQSDTKTTTARRVTSSEQVRDMLKAAGFEAKVVSSRTATTRKELSPWTFPVTVILAEDETNLTIVLGLSAIKDCAKELPAKTLLAMMEASQTHAPHLFTYHSKRERTELSLVVKNQNLTGQQLRDEINRMAVLAKNMDKIWALKSETPAKNETPSDPGTPQTTANFVGKWSAARSTTEAFAVEFTANGKFNLVHIKNGNQTKSTGTFTAENGSLNLIGIDGVKLAGKLTINSATQFRFQIQNSAALVFQKAS
jgi:hypothetical protein